MQQNIIFLGKPVLIKQRKAPVTYTKNNRPKPQAFLIFPKKIPKLRYISSLYKNRETLVFEYERQGYILNLETEQISPCSLSTFEQAKSAFEKEVSLAANIS